LLKSCTKERIHFRKGGHLSCYTNWALLQHNQKWLKRKDEAPPKRQKSTNSIEFAGAEDLDEDGVQNEDGRGRSPVPCSIGPTDKRPPSRKAAKEKLKKG